MTLRHALVAQEGVDARFAAPEGFEGLEGGAAAADFQDLLTEASTGFGAGGTVRRCGFFKGCIGIGLQHFGPFVAVVAGAVATGKDMAEAVRHAAEFGHR